MKDFTGTVTVITGAGSGMGRAYALESAARGATLALNDYDEAALKETVSLLPSTTTVLSRAFDVSDRDAMYAFAAAVGEQLGNAGVVINNAGIEGDVRPVWATDGSTYERVMGVNFFGVLHGTQAFLPQLLDGDAGAIVNVSSLFGLVAPPHHADYSASKFAVRGFTEALAAELQGTPVRVHLVHPGGIATNISRHEGSRAFAEKYFKTSAEEIVRVVLDAVGTRRTRIVHGHRAPLTWVGARLLPLPVMGRLLWRDLAGVLDRDRYPALGGR